MIGSIARFCTILLLIGAACLLAAEPPLGESQPKTETSLKEQTQPLLRQIVPECVLIVHCRGERVEDQVLNKVLSVWHGAYNPLAFTRHPRTGYIGDTGGDQRAEPAVGAEVVLFFKKETQPGDGIGRHELAVPVRDGVVTYPVERQAGFDVVVEPRKFTLKDFEREVKLLIDDKPAEAVPRNPGANQARSGLAGNWRLLLPAGYDRPVTLKETGQNRYRLEPGNLNCSGVYELRDKRLVLIEPREPRLSGFEWQVRSPYMASLVGQASNTGADYSGAVLFRAK